uniref:Long-chain-fatty-acid--CoA ligase n=1 Tax=Branchiostoma floridae TaxID=7739 RepID=C3XRF2_BRAFL|eukprot:XP_002613261.1 hypothetical protein BRAFLDRAFT_68226 [Branchiostoma floridae]
MVKPAKAALYATVGGISTAVAAVPVFYPQIRQDLKFMWKYQGPMSRFRRYTSAQPPVSLVDRFLHQVQLQPDKPFVLFEDQLYTYKDVDVMSNKVANFFHGDGLTCGDTVAMLVYNEPAFIWTFLGLAKLGVKIALLNTNLRNKSLLHCFKAAEAKVLIIGVTVWMQGDNPALHGLRSLDDKINQTSDQPIPFKLRENVLVNDTLCYIYTSGTTGHDGRAGMAAIVVHPGHLPNMWEWYAHLSSRLPGYARPLFLRLTQHLTHTTTFKQTKAELIKEGFDPNVVTDRLYFRDDSKKTYVPLDSEVYKTIAVGKAKL